MKKLTYSFLLLMLLTSVPALADYAPVNVQTALKKNVSRRQGCCLVTG